MNAGKKKEKAAAKEKEEKKKGFWHAHEPVHEAGAGTEQAKTDEKL